jgi:hypothetical protein
VVENADQAVGMEGEPQLHPNFLGAHRS